MENKEAISAANALIAWFNAQEISASDASSVMSKVLAKLITKNSRLDRTSLHLEIDRFTFQLTGDINDRLWQERNRK